VHNPSAVPDLIFSAEDMGFNPLLEIYETKAEANGLAVMSLLVDRNYKDPSRLLNLICKLRYVTFCKCLLCFTITAIVGLLSK
jgi:hypothetical protein